MAKYKVITLCGSTRFKDEFQRVQTELTLQGDIVISVGLFGHFGDDEVRSLVPISGNEYADISVLKVLIDSKMRDSIKDVAKDSGYS